MGRPRNEYGLATGIARAMLSHNCFRTSSTERGGRAIDQAHFASPTNRRSLCPRIADDRRRYRVWLETTFSGR